MVKTGTWDQSETGSWDQSEYWDQSENWDQSEKNITGVKTTSR